MMNQEVKNKWLTALRSGEYEQGIGVLRSKEGKFCCLGVLCNLAMMEGVTHIIDIDFYDDTIYGKEDCYSSSISLPEEVSQWSGVGETGKLPITIKTGDDGYYDNLIDLNDEVNYSFSQIADIIEKYL